MTKASHKVCEKHIPDLVGEGAIYINYYYLTMQAMSQQIPLNSIMSNSNSVQQNINAPYIHSKRNNSKTIYKIKH